MAGAAAQAAFEGSSTLPGPRANLVQGLALDARLLQRRCPADRNLWGPHYTLEQRQGPAAGGGGDGGGGSRNSIWQPAGLGCVLQGLICGLVRARQVIGTGLVASAKLGVEWGGQCLSNTASVAVWRGCTVLSQACRHSNKEQAGRQAGRPCTWLSNSKE